MLGLSSAATLCSSAHCSGGTGGVSQRSSQSPCLDFTTPCASRRIDEEEKKGQAPDAQAATYAVAAWRQTGRSGFSSCIAAISCRSQKHGRQAVAVGKFGPNCGCGPFVGRAAFAGLATRRLAWFKRGSPIRKSRARYAATGERRMTCLTFGALVLCSFGTKNRRVILPCCICWVALLKAALAPVGRRRFLMIFASCRVDARYRSGRVA